MLTLNSWSSYFCFLLESWCVPPYPAPTLLSLPWPWLSPALTLLTQDGYGSPDLALPHFKFSPFILQNTAAGPCRLLPLWHQLLSMAISPAQTFSKIPGWDQPPSLPIESHYPHLCFCWFSLCHQSFSLRHPQALPSSLQMWSTVKPFQDALLKLMSHSLCHLQH